MSMLNLQQNSKTKDIDITPDKSIFYKISQAGYSTAEAIAELVDNSIDARIDGQDLRIEIKIKKDHFEVYDNAEGMNANTLHKAFILGHSKKDGKIGQFGIGLKSAGLSLGSQITVESTPNNDENLYKVRYDDEEWKNSGKDWKLKLEETKGVSKNQHYTKVQISNIKNYYPNLVTIIKKDLGKRYYPLLKGNKVFIKVNRKLCKAIEPELEEGSKKEFSFTTKNGDLVFGWYGLLTESSQKGEYGFTTFHKERMITTFDKIGFTPHATVARIVGEIHLDHVPVTTSKREFEKESKQYKEVIQKLEEEMRDFVLKTKKLSRKDSVSQRVINKVNEYINKITQILNNPDFEEYTQKLQPVLYKQDPNSPELEIIDIEKRDERTNSADEQPEQKDERSREPKKKQDKIKSVIKVQGKKMRFQHSFQNLGQQGPWKAWEITEEEDMINILTNLDFSMTQLINDQSIVALHSIAESIAEVFVMKTFENDHERVIQIKEEILRKVDDEV